MLGLPSLDVPFSNGQSRAYYFGEIMSQVIEHIISQYAEEASFLWLYRDQALDQPHYELKELAGLDNRVEAHIDGLRIAGDAGWDMCRNELHWNEAGEIFASSVLALESGMDERYDLVLEAASQELELTRGFISAIGWLQPEQAKPYAEKLIRAESAMHRRMGIAGAAVHRMDPGSALEEAMKHEDPILRSRALQAGGELGRKDLAYALFPYLKDEDADCRYHAAWAGTLFKIPDATTVLQRLVEEDGDYAERAARIVTRCMKADATQSWLRDLLTRPELTRYAILAMGASGDPAYISQLFEFMTVDDVARVAGESFSMITGVDLAYDDLERDWPEGFEAGPTEDPEDEDVEMDADEDLPWPESELITKWWEENQSRFISGQRYLVGRPITKDSLKEVLRDGFQRQRAAAAFEQVLLEPGTPLFETRAPGFRQQRWLG